MTAPCPEGDPGPAVSRQSIKATYDGRESDPRYHVTYTVNDKPITWREPVEDPFVRGEVVIAWRDMLRAVLTRRRLRVEFVVGGDRDIVNDVLELDSNTLIPGSTRRAAWESHINERLGAQR